MRRRKRVAVLAVVAALLVTGVVWWLWPERVKPFDESEVWTVEVEAPEPPAVVIPTVTIDVTDTPVGEVLAEMNKQAQVALGADEAAKAKRVTLQVKDVPVLQAFGKVAELTASQVNWRDGVGLELTVDQGPASPSPITSVGPCLLQSPSPSGLGKMGQGSEMRCFMVCQPPPLSFSADPRRPSVKPEETCGGVTIASYRSLGPPLPLAWGVVRITFGKPTEVAFDLKADRGKKYLLGSTAITYRGYQEISTHSASWPWPLKRLRFLPERTRIRTGPVWRVEGPDYADVEACFKDSAGNDMSARALTLGRSFSFRFSGMEQARKKDEVHSALVPKGAATLVLRVVAKAAEFTYPLPSRTLPVRTPEGGQRPPVP